MLSVKTASFSGLSSILFPSAAAMASKDWSDASDNIHVSEVVQMEHLEPGGRAAIGFLHFKNVQKMFQTKEKDKISEG